MSWWTRYWLRGSWSRYADRLEASEGACRRLRLTSFQHVDPVYERGGQRRGWVR